MKREPVGQKKRKGQMLVFEQVLMFTIGVAIMIMAFALFTMYQNYYTSSTASDQMTEVKEYVLSSIIKACESEANVTMILTIPKTVSNSFYKISLSNAGLNVTLEPYSGSGDFSPLYGLNETFVFSGMAISDLGKVVVYKNGNLVSLDRRVA
ncbi:MAG: hypothetical protein V1648_01125 [Candidatus Aenigmatarchaeota archaeon]